MFCALTIGGDTQSTISHRQETEEWNSTTIELRGEPVSLTIMKAIILYDKLDLATKARSVLEGAAERADPPTHWSVKRWRVNLLTLPGIGKAALNDSTGAHLILLALRQSESLPIWLPAWLEKWAQRRQVKLAAFAVFDTGAGDRLSKKAPAELAQLIERHGLNFVFGDIGPNQDKSAVVSSNTGLV